MYLVKHNLITNNIVMFALLLKCPSRIEPIMLQSTLKILPYKYKPVQIKHILNRLDLSMCIIMAAGRYHRTKLISSRVRGC